MYWEELDLVLADIERIEVIRGPGATLWGANAVNAVNGIINIVTQSTAQTQGVLVDAGLGTQERILSLRYGGQFGADRHFRVYGKLRQQGASVDTGGSDARDSWSALHGGGRLDWRHTRMGDFQLQAEAMLGDLTNQVWLPQTASPPFVRQRDDITTFGGHALGRWQYESDAGTSWTGQVFYNVQDREEYIEQQVQSVDLDLQGHQQHGAHGLVWGGGLRSTWEAYSRPLALSVEDRSADLTYSLFLQDDMALSEDVHFILGTKLEHNVFSGLEVQPTARLRWSPNKRLSWWGGVSRAVRTPTGGESTVRVILPGASLPESFLPEGVTAGFAAIAGNPDLDAEILHAAETGFRTLAASWLLLDVSAFFHDYSDLRSLQQANAYTDSTQTVPVLILPIVFGNNVSGTSHGLEAAADIRLGPTARLTVHYSYLDINLDTSSDSSAEREEGNSPTHQIFIKLRHDPGRRVTLDAGLRYVDRLPVLGTKAYSELDARAGYRVTPGLELYLTLHNALSDRHQEYSPVSLNSDPAQIERAVAMRLTWRP